MAITLKKNRNCKSQIPLSIEIQVLNHNGNIVDYRFTVPGIPYFQTIEELKKKYNETKFIIKSIAK